MPEIEILTTKIGELVSCEIEEVDKVEYEREKGLTAFTIIMQDGKRYALEIKAIA